MINKINDEEEYIKFIDNIIQSSENDSLFFFIGAGVSISQGYPTWDEYVERLIEYWEYHLMDLSDNVNSKFLVSVEHIKILTQLKESSMSKKRKIDFVNSLIRDLCIQLRGESGINLYDSRVLDFEKFLFSDVRPMDVTNKILDELMNIHSNFITTNYDNQIEKSFDQRYNIKPHIISDLESDFDISSYENIIHLHGLPTSHPEYFINSATNYSKIYFDNQKEYKNKFQKIFFNKRKITVIFVGCSMEEDEILSLFDLHDENISYYSLMKFDSTNKELSDFTKKYYLNEKGINFLWYGDKFEELSAFLNSVNKDISNKKMNGISSQDEIRQVMLGEGF